MKTSLRVGWSGSDFEIGKDTELPCIPPVGMLMQFEAESSWVRVVATRYNLDKQLLIVELEPSTSLTPMLRMIIYQRWYVVEPSTAVDIAKEIGEAMIELSKENAA